MSDRQHTGRGLRPRCFNRVADVASYLGVPAAWLDGEAKRGRIPFIQVGRSRLCNPDQVSEALLERAKREAEKLRGSLDPRTAESGYTIGDVCKMANVSAGQLKAILLAAGKADPMTSITPDRSLKVASAIIVAEALLASEHVPSEDRRDKLSALIRKMRSKTGGTP